MHRFTLRCHEQCPCESLEAEDGYLCPVGGVTEAARCGLHGQFLAQQEDLAGGQGVPEAVAAQDEARACGRHNHLPDVRVRHDAAPNLRIACAHVLITHHDDPAVILCEIRKSWNHK